MLTIAFLELSTTCGVHDMTVRSLAATLGTAPGSLTYHYGTKDELFATCARVLGRWLQYDVSERIVRDGPGRAIPATDPADDHEERQYLTRLRAWLQLTAYSFDAPGVVAVVGDHTRALSLLMAAEDPTSGWHEILNATTAIEIGRAALRRS